MIQFELFSAPRLSCFSHVLAPRARMKMVWCDVKLLIDLLRLAMSGLFVEFCCLATCRNSGICFRSLPFLRGLFLLGDHHTHEKRLILDPFVLHAAMVEREPLVRAKDRAMVVGRKDEGAREGVPRVDEETFQRLTLTELPRRIPLRQKLLHAVLFVLSN